MRQGHGRQREQVAQHDPRRATISPQRRRGPQKRHPQIHRRLGSQSGADVQQARHAQEAHEGFHGDPPLGCCGRENLACLDQARHPRHCEALQCRPLARLGLALRPPNAINTHCQPPKDGAQIGEGWAPPRVKRAHPTLARPQQDAWCEPVVLWSPRRSSHDVPRARDRRAGSRTHLRRGYGIRQPMLARKPANRPGAFSQAAHVSRRRDAIHAHPHVRVIHRRVLRCRTSAGCCQ